MSIVDGRPLTKAPARAHSPVKQKPAAARAEPPKVSAPLPPPNPVNIISSRTAAVAAAGAHAAIASFQLSPAVEAVLKTVQGNSSDPFDSPTFNAVTFVNSQFTDEASLIAVPKAADGSEPQSPSSRGPRKLDALTVACKRQVHTLSEEVSRLVRESSSQRDTASRYVADMRGAVQELFGKVNSIQSRAETSQRMVDEICGDIKRLDVGKRNVGAAREALKKLYTLNATCEHLKFLNSQRDYKSAAAALPQVASLLNDAFGPYKQVGKIRELNAAFEALQKELFQSIFTEFRQYVHNHNEAAEQSLADACAVLDAFDDNGKARGDLLSWFTKQQIENYRALFQPGPNKVDTGFEATDKRFDLWKQITQVYRERWLKVFPTHWNALGQVCEEFCTITKEHFTQLLSGPLPDVTALVDTLRKTIAFESRQNRLLNPQTAVPQKGQAKGKKDEEDDEDKDEQPIVAEAESAPAPQPEVEDESQLSEAERIRRKYQRQFQERAEQDAIARETAAQRQQREAAAIAAKEKAEKEKADKAAAEAKRLAALANAKVYAFRGMISSCFMPYMGQYVKLEQTNVRSLLDQMHKQEDWVPKSITDAREQLDSATHMFNYIKASKAECGKLSTGALFFDVYQVYKSLIRSFIDKLASHVQSFEALSRQQGADSMVDVHYLSLVLAANTAAHCSDTMPGLKESIVNQIDEYFKPKVDLEKEQNDFDMLINKSLQMIVSCIVTRVSASMERFSRVDWATFSDEFYENTEHTQQLISYVNELVPHIAPRITPAYQSYFYNQLAQALFSRFTQAIYACRRVSADGVQQMIVDAKGLQAMLEGVPLLGFKQAAKDDMLLDDLALDRSSANQDGPRKAPPAFLKYVRAEGAKLTSALKVMSSVKEQILDAYQRLFGRAANAAELARLLELRTDLRPEERQAILNQFSAQNSTGAVATAPKPSVTGSKDTVVSTAIANLLKF